MSQGQQIPSATRLGPGGDIAPYVDSYSHSTADTPNPPARFLSQLQHPSELVGRAYCRCYLLTLPLQTLPPLTSPTRPCRKSTLPLPSPAKSRASADPLAYSPPFWPLLTGFVATLHHILTPYQNLLYHSTNQPPSSPFHPLRGARGG